MVKGRPRARQYRRVANPFGPSVAIWIASGRNAVMRAAILRRLGSASWISAQQANRRHPGGAAGL
jgi:hypothetical protein